MVQELTRGPETPGQSSPQPGGADEGVLGVGGTGVLADGDLAMPRPSHGSERRGLCKARLRKPSQSHFLAGYRGIYNM